MPYIDKYQRDSLEELLRMYRQYPYWKNPNENAQIMQSIIGTWLEIITKDKPFTLDGYLNFMCTWMIKHTHRTYCVKGGDFSHKKYNPFDKDIAYFVRHLFTMIFEQHGESYYGYERLYGLLSLMEAEFKRREWSKDRPDIQAFFRAEKRYWSKQIAIYEDKKITENTDID
jgi:hypothetical protein